MSASRHSATLTAPLTAPVDEFRRLRRTGEAELRDRLIIAHGWLADRCARRYANRGEPLADLRQVARLGLVKAVDRFDPDRGVAFTTFAEPTVSGEIKRYFRDRSWAVGVSRTTKDRRTAVLGAVEELEQRLGRAPNAAEVAASTGDTESGVEDVLAANRAYRPAPIDRIAGDPVVDQRDGPTDALVARDALRALDDRSRRILYLRYYEDCTQREIGDRIGVCQVQVSRLIRAAIDELRRQLDVEAN